MSMRDGRTFGAMVRRLRLARGLNQRDLASAAGVHFTYISKIENGRLDFNEFPSEPTTRRLAHALGADRAAFLLAIGVIPDAIRRRILERPEVFGRLAALTDAELDRLLGHLDRHR
jgi:HTH-type transcriptional regulator, competence development regulator